MIAFLNAFLLSFAAQAVTHHEIQAVVNPETHQIAVTDSVTLHPSTNLASPQVCESEYIMTIHSGLNPVVVGTVGVRFVLISRESVDAEHALEVEHYRLTLPCRASSVTFQYQGEIFHPVLEANNPYSQGTNDTPGLISTDGVVLSSETYWFPQFDGVGDSLVSFTLDTTMPEGWTVVSQGEQLEKGRWQESHPQDDLFLIAAKFTKYEKTSASGVKIQAFLRTPDETIAQNYLAATSEYIDRYSQLIGPYPYAKFALVENFWNTGFGMPSFTLLGSDIIRLPFIINTSYPHEILHDWWGNSVYVDYQRGNWCEGITAYMADHLMAERAGQGDAYRRDTLQKYTDFVNEKNDFPLTKFVGRTDAPTEAVGYGKALMFFHMLRREVGDELFYKSFSKFYADNQYKRVSYSEIRESFEATMGHSFELQFAQWVERTGAPTLKISKALSQKISENSFQFNGHIQQIQSEEAFELNVPVRIRLENQEKVFEKTYPMKGRDLEISEIFSSLPVWFEVDPAFDLFRRLSRDEVPPALTMGLGAAKTLMILPASTPPETVQNWKNFAALIQGALPQSSNGAVDVEVVLDRDVKEIPSDRAVWILGHENLFASRFASLLSDQSVKFGAEGIELSGTNYTFVNHSFLLLGRNKDQADQVWIFADTDQTATFSILANKITHYGKYSYLVFESEQVKNVAKGIWKLKSSAMSVPVGH